MSEIDQRPVNNPVLAKNRNPYTVWFVVLSFIAPVALAYVMFFFVDIKSFSNHGEILNPIAHISNFALKDENGKIIPQEKLTYKWRLISFLGKDCDQRCAKRLYDTRQIHKSLGKNQYRLYRMFVHLEPAGETFTKLIANTHADAIQVNAEPKDVVKALNNNVHDDVGITNNEIYIMDPMGNVMMRFTQDQSNKDILSDLRKLLKASQIG